MLSQTPQRRGAETFGLQLREALEERGHEGRIVYLYAYAGTEPITMSETDRCLEFDPDHPLERLLTLNPRLLRAIRREIRIFRPDILHLNGARSVKYGALASIGSGCGVVYRNIDSPRFWNTDWKRQAYYRYLVFPRIDGVSGVSERTLREVEEMYGLGGTDTVLQFIPNAIQVSHLEAGGRDVRAELGIDPNAPLVMFFGKLTEQKRPDRWIQAFAALRRVHPEVRGLVVGDGPLRPTVEAAIRKHGLQDAVTLCGYQRSVGPFVEAADLLLLSSDTEGIPAAILEAGYLAVPTVAPRVGGVEECVLDGETGILSKANDPAALADAAGRLIADPERRRTMGREARQFVSENFLMGAVAPRYEALYERVLASR